MKQGLGLGDLLAQAQGQAELLKYPEEQEEGKYRDDVQPAAPEESRDVPHPDILEGKVQAEHQDHCPVQEVEPEPVRLCLLVEHELGDNHHQQQDDRIRDDAVHPEFKDVQPGLHGVMPVSASLLMLLLQKRNIYTSLLINRL